MEPRTLVTLMDVNLGRQSRNTSIVAAFHSTGQSGNRLRKVEGTTKLLATPEAPGFEQGEGTDSPTWRCL